MGILSRRDLLCGFGGLGLYTHLRYYSVTSQKDALVAIFDKAGIDCDAQATEVAVKVNGSEVTGTEGGQVIFKFSPRGQLVGIVVWNEKISDQKESL